MEKKRKPNLFFKILAILFLIFTSLIIAYESGYYETKAKGRATLTKEAMEKFEEDLQKGEMVDLKEYLVEEKEDYSNGVTKMGNKLSKSVSDIMTKGISGIFDALKGLFW